jgi:membrane protease YdiL (CAAX protease family)
MTFSDPQTPFPPDGVPIAPESESQSTAAPRLPLPPQPPPPQENFPEDLRTPWGGGEILLFLGFAFGSAILMQIVLSLVLIAHFRMTPAQIGKLLETKAAVAVGFQAAWYAVLFLFLLVIIRVYHGAAFWSSLRWRFLRAGDVAQVIRYLTCIFGGIALAFGVNAASQIVGEKKNLPIEQLFGTRTDVLWLMAFGIAVAPIVEEIIFRGFLYPVFARRWGIPAGIVITGVLFGGMHAAQLWPAYPQIALLVVVGIVLTFARARSGSVLASYLIHVSYNSCLFSGFFLFTHGLKNIPPIH